MLDLQTHIVSRGGACHLKTIPLRDGRHRYKAIVKLPIPNAEQVYIEAVYQSEDETAVPDAVTLVAFHKAQHLLDLFLANVAIY